MRNVIFPATLIILFSSNAAHSKIEEFKVECGIGYIKKVQQNRIYDGNYSPMNIELDITGIPQIGTPKDTKVTVTQVGGSGEWYEYPALQRISDTAMTAMQYRLPVRLASRTDDCIGNYKDIIIQACTDETTCRN